MDPSSHTVVDIHSHLWQRDWMPEAWWDALADVVASQYQLAGVDRDAAYVRREYIPTYWDDGSHLLERMDEADIDHQIVFTVDFGLAFDDPDVPIQDVNRKVADFEAENPDRITTLATIDPRREGAAEHIETALGDWDMSGLKLHPTAGFYLHDDETYEILEVVADHDLPVLTDSGPIFAPLYGECSHPNHIDRVLADFPNLTLIAAHLSFGWWRDLLAIAEQKVNSGLHVDISGWQREAREDFDEFAHVVREFVDALGADRVHWGTDDPTLDPTLPKEKWLDNVAALTDHEDPSFTDAEVEQILGAGTVDLFSSHGIDLV
jgi:predicted TIM-barrel fold metal-dependent hydrolase